MFTAGAAVQTTAIGVGKSFGCNAIRRDNHDTVSAMLMVPCREIARRLDISGGTQPAEPAEPQRAEKPSSSQSMQQPWVQEHRQRHDISGIWTEHLAAAAALDRQLRQQQDDSWEDHPDVAEKLGAILFKKRKVGVGSNSAN